MLRNIEVFLLKHPEFVHFRGWYRHQLAPYLKEVMLDQRSRSRPWLNGAALEPMILGHIKGTHNRTVEIHKLLSLELLHRTLIES